MLQRRDTAANWTANDPILGAGEIGFETDTNKFKFGDGSSAWSALSYAAGEGGGINLTGTTNGESIIWEEGAWVLGPDIGGYTSAALDTSVYDPYWDYVVYLIDFDDQPNLGTSYTGIEKANRFFAGTTWTNSGAGSTSTVTAEKKWGTSSLRMDGTNYVLSNESYNEWACTKWPVTIDMWLRLDSDETTWGMVACGTNEYMCWYDGTNFQVYFSGGYIITFPYTFPTEQWMYLAVVLYDDGAEAAVYLDGTRIGHTTTGQRDETSMNGNDFVAIGFNSNYRLKGHVQELRFTTAARFSGATCPVPTAKFPQQGPPAGTVFGYNNYSVSKLDDVDLSTLSPENGSSLIYNKTADAWFAGPSVGSVVPDGDSEWAKVQLYHPLDGDMTENLGNDQSSTLTAPTLDQAGYYKIGNSKFGRGALSKYHSSTTVSFNYDNYAFTSNQDWVTDFWYYLDSSDALSQLVFTARMNPNTVSVYDLSFNWSSNNGGHYYLFSRTSGHPSSTSYQWDSDTAGDVNNNILPMDTWFHTALVFDYTKNCMRVYINGRRWPYGTIWFSQGNTNGGNPTFLDTNVDVRFAPSTTNASGSMMADWRLTTNTQRYGFVDPQDVLETFTPEEARLTNASTGDYVWVEDRKSDYVVNTTAVPTLATDAGKVGDIRYDDNYIYMCTAPDTWKRATLATW